MSGGVGDDGLAPAGAAERVGIVDVLDFWLGEPADDAATLQRKLGRWFEGGPALDREVTERFGPLVEEALAGRLAGWAVEPRGRLALVIVLDQLARNALRGQARAYAGAAVAERLALEAFDRGWYRGLSLEERLFLLMPLMHAEDLAHQDRAVALVEELAADAPDELRPTFGLSVEQARKYRDIIARFGRFPHRNAVLGRVSTPEEGVFLSSWAEHARPRGEGPERARA